MALFIRYLILGVIAYLAIKLVKKKLANVLGPDINRVNNPKLDPYEVLEIRRGASKEEIRRAYKQAISKYHPDKVEHLGEEIKRLAREKTLIITQAYHSLR